MHSFVYNQVNEPALMRKFGCQVLPGRIAERKTKRDENVRQRKNFWWKKKDKQNKVAGRKERQQKAKEQIPENRERQRKKENSMVWKVTCNFGAGQSHSASVVLVPTASNGCCLTFWFNLSSQRV